MSEYTTLEAIGSPDNETDYKRRVAKTILHEILSVFPANIRNDLLNLEKLPLEEQAELMIMVHTAYEDSEHVLADVYLSRKLLEPEYETRDEFFIDPVVHSVERGHKLFVMYEEAVDGGSSRTDSRMLRKFKDKITWVTTDTKNPDMKKLKSDWHTGNQAFRLGSENSESHKASVIDMYLKDWTHPGFANATESRKVLESRISDEFEMKVITGVVIEPPRPGNSGVIMFEDGSAVNMSDVRYCSIIGIDRDSFLTRGDDELYLHRKVRIWFEEKWHIGRIRQLIDHDYVEVRCDEKVHDGDHLKGHGLTIKKYDFDLDIRDISTPELIHPLQDYPLLRRNNCIRFRDRDGRFMLGYIDNLDTTRKRIIIETPYGTKFLNFDGQYEIIDTTGEPPADPLLEKGNTFQVFDIQEGKYRVFSIKGVDYENNKIIGYIESLRPRNAPLAWVFHIDNVELLGDPETVLQEKPYLRKRYHEYNKLFVEFKIGENVLIGEVLTSDTLPAFVEIIIEKETPDDSGDDYYRYDIPPQDILSEVSEVDSDE